MQIHLTQGASRVLLQAERIAKDHRAATLYRPCEIDTETLLLALLRESEYRAADWLLEAGIDERLVLNAFFQSENQASETTPEAGLAPDAASIDDTIEHSTVSGNTNGSQDDAEPMEDSQEKRILKLESPVSAPGFAAGDYGNVYAPESGRPRSDSIRMGNSAADREPMTEPFPQRQQRHQHQHQQRQQTAGAPLSDDFQSSQNSAMIGRNSLSIARTAPKTTRSTRDGISWLLEERELPLIRTSEPLTSAILSAFQRHCVRETVSGSSLIIGSSGSPLRIQSSAQGKTVFEFATEHLLLAVALEESVVGQWIRERGIDPTAVYERIRSIRCQGQEIANAVPGAAETLPLPFEEESKSVPPVSTSNDATPFSAAAEFINGKTPSGQSPREIKGGLEKLEKNVYRLLDAAANRAGEAFRVIDDCVRFMLDDAELARTLKEMRHEFGESIRLIPFESRIAHRDTEADVGTSLEGSGEYRRNDLNDVLIANFSRLQESLRSLEEYGKLAVPQISRRIESLRYRSYTLQKTILEGAPTKPSRIGSARLYVLIDCGNIEEEFIGLVRTLLAEGVDVIQLRDKRADDRTIVSRAKILRNLTKDSGALFVMNDRADIALVSGADGLHLGQNELTPSEARLILGCETLIGISTHNIDQARQAVLDGADYIGIGPVFPSSTKSFDDFPGLEFLKEVAAEIRIPAFAIGGISLDNISEVQASGIFRVAVGSAIVSAAVPKDAVRKLRAIIDGKKIT